MFQSTNSRYYYPDSTVNMSSISHLTGAFTAPLVQRIWEQSGHSEETMFSLFGWWEQMFDAGRERDLLESIRQVCGILGHAFAEEIISATQDPQIRNAFIISFLSDYDDALMDLTGDAPCGASVFLCERSGGPLPWIEPEELATAKAVDLYSYLTVAEPSNIKRCHDSLKLSASSGKWNWHSRGFGGTTAVQCLMKVRGYSLPEAAQIVLDSRAAPYLPYVAQEPPKPFVLPPKHTDAEKVIKYLYGERCVSREIVAHCLDSGQLYESAYYHSCVFVGYEEAHRPRHAAIRATGGAFMQDVEGSDKRYSFALQAQNRACTVLYVFESAIDALSLATIRQIQGEAWRDIHYLSLAGVSALTIEQFLNHPPEITEIRLCLDADEPGQLAAERIINVLHLSRPQLEILYEPPKAGKDYNRQLQIFTRLKVRYVSKPKTAQRGCERA